MAKLTWDKTSERLYETGVKQCALYVQKENGEYNTGVAWNGITSVSESPEGAEAEDIYADDIKYLTLRSAEELKATLNAYMYPKAFEQCDGLGEIAEGVSIGQQSRRAFGLAYMTTVGNDTMGNDYGKKIHLLYNITASPSEKEYGTINDSPEAIEFSWELSLNKVDVEGFKPTAMITIDSTKVDPEKFKTLEGMIYGTENTEPTLPLPKDIIDLFKTQTDESQQAAG